MTQTSVNPLIDEACQAPDALQNLQHSNAIIDKVTKNLNEYLHSKQLLFSRFFFLSNDDLLHMLSQTKEPLRVQEHLNKCFEGKTLHFEKDTLLVKGMYSAIGEYVAFENPVDPYVNEEEENEGLTKRELRKIEKAKEEAGETTER